MRSSWVKQVGSHLIIRPQNRKGKSRGRGREGRVWRGRQRWSGTAGCQEMPPGLRSKRQGGILPWSTWREGSPVSTSVLDSVTVRECVAIVLSLPVCGDLSGQP